MFELQRFIQEIPGHILRDAPAEPVRVRPLLPFKDAKAVLVERFEREYVLQLLRRCEGNITRAGRESGLHRKSIERLVKKYQLHPKGMKPRRERVSPGGGGRP